MLSSLHNYLGSYLQTLVFIDDRLPAETTSFFTHIAIGVRRVSATT